jgi:hypothetical protein
MPIAWYVCPYKRITGRPVSRPGRYCAMDDFTAEIIADGGAWTESEVLGDCAVVKVRASDATLTTINAATGFTRIPLTALSQSLGSLTAAQRTAIRNRIVAAGYTMEEINARFPNIANATLRQVLEFWARRRLKPRYDAASDTIVLDGDVQPCRPIIDVDAEVQ